MKRLNDYKNAFQRTFTFEGKRSQITIIVQSVKLF